MAATHTLVGISRASTKRAHSNLLMAALNAALDQGLIGPGDGENHWPGSSNKHTFRFEFPGGHPAAAYLHDIGGELAIHVALQPSNDLSWLSASNAGFDAGEAFVVGWAEREQGFWLQDSFKGANIRRALLPHIAAAAIRPKGYRIGPFFR